MLLSAPGFWNLQSLGGEEKTMVVGLDSLSLSSRYCYFFTSTAEHTSSSRRENLMWEDNSSSHQAEWNRMEGEKGNPHQRILRREKNPWGDC